MRQNKHKLQKKLEKLTDRDLNYLMDTSKPIYKRAKGGAFRQR
ncbi:hypothetical protein [Bacillus changyiensis]|nr:hypothetical protein [Bacillus changyiensis]MDA1478375.1 hypothetical protein [Bacillus changyiensis]